MRHLFLQIFDIKRIFCKLDTKSPRGFRSQRNWTFWPNFAPSGTKNGIKINDAFWAIFLALQRFQRHYSAESSGQIKLNFFLRDLEYLRKKRFFLFYYSLITLIFIPFLVPDGAKIRQKVQILYDLNPRGDMISPFLAVSNQLRVGGRHSHEPSEGRK